MLTIHEKIPNFDEFSSLNFKKCHLQVKQLAIRSALLTRQKYRVQFNPLQKKLHSNLQPFFFIKSTYKKSVHLGPVYEQYKKEKKIKRNKQSSLVRPKRYRRESRHYNYYIPSHMRCTE